MQSYRVNVKGEYILVDELTAEKLNLKPVAMPFIKLTRINGDKCLVRILEALVITAGEGGQGSDIFFPGDGDNQQHLLVQETVEEIAQCLFS